MRLERMMRAAVAQIRKLDRKLMKYVGLATDPQARKAVDQLLDERLILMAERERGFRIIDRRKLSEPR